MFLNFLNTIFRRIDYSIFLHDEILNNIFCNIGIRLHITSVPNHKKIQKLGELNNF